MRKFLVVGVLCALMGASLGQAERARWTPEQAEAWQAKQAWPVGANFLPSTAGNQLEMWQAATWDPATIDRELGLAHAIGMNTVRVFLHDLLWQQDANGWSARVDEFLRIAQKNGIKPVLVLFDSCWNPEPHLGPQGSPIAGVHNSMWVQSPGVAMTDPTQYPRLEAYVKGIVGRFKDDDRILAWDVWNEPDNEGGGNYQTHEPQGKVQLVATLLPRVFAWARSVSPSQPLTSGVWHDEHWDQPQSWNAVERTQLTESDIISFHNYGWPEVFAAKIEQLRPLHRPILCTEYMARGSGSTFDESLPIAARLNVGAINWGLVKGREQTNLPWESWQHPYVLDEPPVWTHDVFWPDGHPYRQAEAQLIRSLTEHKEKWTQ